MSCFDTNDTLFHRAKPKNGTTTALPRGLHVADRTKAKYSRILARGFKFSRFPFGDGEQCTSIRLDTSAPEQEANQPLP